MWEWMLLFAGATLGLLLGAMLCASGRSSDDA